MLEEYRRWLESELALLGNASHHAYAFGQANMAKRALEQLDAALAEQTTIALSPAEAAAALEDLSALATSDRPLPKPLAVLAAKLREATGAPQT